MTHPPTTATTVPPATTGQPEKPAAARPARRALRLPPPKILAAAALVVVALELLVWQVGGLFWGGVIHGVLLVLVGIGLLVWLRWRNRREVRLARTVAGQAARFAGLGQRAGLRPARGPLARLLGRTGRANRAGAGSSGGGRSGGSGRRGLLSRLTGGRRTAAGRTGGGRSGSGTGRSAGRAGGLLGRLGGAAKRATARRQATEKRPGFGRGQWGVRFGRRASAGTWRPSLRKAGKPARRSTQLRRGAVAAFLRGVREGAQGKPQPKKPSPGPQPGTEAQAKPAPKPEQHKPQPPTREELVKEAVEKVADATPAPVTSRRSRGTTVGSMRDILTAAEELAAQMKAYDEEDMHVFVRELPQLGEALAAVEGGIKMMASRAESEWPLAAPVVEALGSVAGDVRAAASTVGEAKQAVHRENETDIERGEAPRQGERRWNV